jgi:spermidine/putrescine transport system permease protein
VIDASWRSPATAVVSLIGLLFLVLPLAVVVLFSFHETASLSLPFTGFSLRWYEQVLSSAEFLNATRHSLVVASGVAVGTLIAGSLAAYGLSRTTSRLRAPLALLFFLPITLPGLFLGLALLVFFAGLDIKLSLVTVAIGHFVYSFPYFLLVVKAALDRMDEALEEAAADLGADPWTVFRRVTLPQMWPVLMGATALAFALSLDEFVITFFVIGSQSTLPLYIWSGLRRTIDPSINTVSSLLMLASLLIFVVAFLFTLRGRAGRFAQMPMPPASAGTPA